MSPWAAVICNMVYNVWDISAALEMISTWPAVIWNMVYNVREIKNHVNNGTSDINMVCEVWDITAPPEMKSTWCTRCGISRHP